MCTLKLFDAAEPGKVLDERRLVGGALTVGRDPGPGGWELADPERLISRAHCVFTEVAGRISVRDLSANGVRLAGEESRLPRDVETPVSVGEVLRLGRFSILVGEDPLPPPVSPFAPPPGAALTATTIRMAPASEPAAERVGSARSAENDFDAPFRRPMLAPSELTETTIAVPSDWGPSASAAASTPPAALPDAELLEAFCAGARLDPSVFVGEDPREVMQALGAVYRQMVLGLSDLMTERVTVKSEYRMTRTTVGSENNNLFKWAGAQRVAVDLLRRPADGFLSGPAAVNECFSDLKKHVLCVMAGLRATVASTLEGLDPGRVAGGEGRGLFGVGRSGALETLRRQHAEFAASAASDPDGPVNRAFREAYERKLAELDAQAAATPATQDAKAALDGEGSRRCGPRP